MYKVCMVSGQDIYYLLYIALQINPIVRVVLFQIQFYKCPVIQFTSGSEAARWR